jgi:hypothetical protein
MWNIISNKKQGGLIMDFIIVTTLALITLCVVPITLMYFWEYKEKHTRLK